MLFLEFLRILFGKSAPALGAEQEIDGLCRLRIRAQEEVGVFQILRPTNLGRKQEMRRHALIRFFVGQFERALIDDRNQGDGRLRLIVFIRCLNADMSSLTRSVIRLIRLHG